jgi:pseudomonalisin/xanthomonalisin
LQQILAASVTAALLFSSVEGASAAALRQRNLSATAGWAPTLTRAFLPKGATDLGAAPSAMPLHLALGLHGDLAGANALIHRITSPRDPLYGRTLTPQQFTAMFAPSSAAATSVATYLANLGMQHITIAPNRLLVTADTTVATASKAFGTQIDELNFNGSAIVGNVAPAMVPAALGGIVDSVLGLETRKNSTFLHRVPARVRAMLARHTRRQARRMRFDASTPDIPATCDNTVDAATLLPGALLNEVGITLPTVPAGTPVPNLPLPFCYPASFNANEFRTAYDDQANPTASKTVVADFVESLPSGPAGSGALSDVVNDLYTMEAYDGIPQSPIYVRQVGSTVSSDTSGEVEWDLDSQATVGIGGGVKSYVFYNAGDISQDGTAELFNQFATDDNVLLGNASFGDCEALYQLTGGLSTTDLILAETVLQGQTIFASAGDSGSFCGTLNGVDGGAPDVIYPSASPYAISVGGTSLLVSSTTGAYYSEISWINGGGGVATFEQQSPWQSNLVANAGNLGLGVTAGPRLVPDLAMEGDEYTGMTVFVSGTQTLGIGGTSLSAPLAGGVYARIESRHGNALGMAGPILYQTYYNGGGGILGTTAPTSVTPPVIAGFHDEIIGSDGLYSALPGYDLNTGMGSFDIDKTFITFGS